MSLNHRSISSTRFGAGLPRAAAALAPALLLLSPALAQSGKLSPAEIEAEIAFASGLAADWGFVDIAEGVVQRLEATSLSGATENRLSLLKCDLYSQAARAERDEVKRGELFDQALASYDTFLANGPDGEIKEQAQTEFVLTSFLYGTYIERDLEEAVGADRETLTAKLSSVLENANQLTGDLIESLTQTPDRSEADNLRLYTLILYRGSMLGLLGKANGNQYFLEESRATLEQMDFVAGEGTPAALKAYVAIGDSYMFENLPEDAAAYYESVVEQTIPSYDGEWETIKSERQLTPSDVALYFAFVEEATSGTVDAYIEAGVPEQAMHYSMHFLNTLRKEGMTLGNDGYESLLAIGRALVQAGGFIGGDVGKGEAKWYATREEMESEVRSRRLRQTSIDLAMDIANQVNDERTGSYLQPRAQKLIGQISERPGVTVSVANQLDGALGLVNTQEFGEAIGKLRAVLNTLESSDEATRLEHGATVMTALGDSYRRTGRDLEAAIAYRESVTTYKSGDPEQNAKNAKRFNTQMRNVIRSTGSEAGPLGDMVSQSEAIVVELGSDGKYDVLFRAGMKLLQEKDYPGARAKFEQIPLDDKLGEPAFVEVAYSYYAEKNMEKALELFNKYLEEIVGDPQYDSESPARIAGRKSAMAKARLYRARIKYQAKNYAEVVALAGTLHEDYPENAPISNLSLDMVMRSHLKLGDRAGARGSLQSMLDMFPDSDRTANAGKVFYNELAKQLKTVTEPEERLEILVEMANHLERAVENGDKSYPTLWNLSLHWSETGEIRDALAIADQSGPSAKADAAYESAETSLKIAVERFVDDSERSDDVTKRVSPKLGAVLLRLKKVPDAHAVLTPLVMSEGAKPARQTVMDWTRALSGWLEGGGDQGPIVEIPGAGGTVEQFERAIKSLNAISKGSDFTAFTTCGWYEVKFLQTYTYYAWSKEDSSKASSISSQLNAIASQLSSKDWSDVENWCADPEGGDASILERLGGNVLRDRYRWLQRKGK